MKKAVNSGMPMTPPRFPKDSWEMMFSPKVIPRGIDRDSTRK
jgi:hypothetical protein